MFPNNNLVHLTTASCCNVLLLAIPVRSSQIRSMAVHVNDKLESNSSTSSEKHNSFFIVTKYNFLNAKNHYYYCSYHRTKC